MTNRIPPGALPAGADGAKVIALHEPAIQTFVERPVAEIAVRLAGVRGPAAGSGREQWLQSFLAMLGPRECLSLRLSMAARGGVSFGAVASADPDRVERRAADLSAALREVLASALPFLKPDAAAHAEPTPTGFVQELRPGGIRISLDDLVRLAPRAVAAPGATGDVGQGGGQGNGLGSGQGATPALWLASCPDRRPDLAAVAALLSRPALRDAELHLTLQAFQLGAAQKRALQEVLNGLALNAPGRGGQPLPSLLLNDKALHQIKTWSVATQGLRLGARLSAPRAIDGVVLDMLCQALFGTTRRLEAEEGGIDLAADWPDLDLSFLERLPALPLAKARLDQRRDVGVARRGAGAAELGVLDDNAPFRVEEAARAQHIYMIGGTGTGKSTLMLNMIVQDIAAGRGVIVLDPHGDLWEAVLARVPASRRDDLVLVHPTDARGAFTMNLLEPLSDDVEGEHGRIIDELLDYYKRSMWKEVPEAFGPMFTNYFRNGLLLLMNAEGDAASILDFPRIFGEDAYRTELLRKCTNKDVTFFWRRIVAEASYEASLSNHAPYIVCKITPITGNKHLRQVLGASTSTLDFRRIITERKICLVNLAQRHLAKEASRFLGGMITSRLVTSAKLAQATLPPGERQRVSVYLDEFQTYISAALADGLAEVRKFGLNLVLANQSLSQLHGDRYQAEVAEAVMSNAANVIAFRVGIADAMRLAIRFEPDIAPVTLAQLPNYHAAGLVIGRSGMPRPEVFATRPEPKPPRRRAWPPPAPPAGKDATELVMAGSALAEARARLVGSIAARGRRSAAAVA